MVSTTEHFVGDFIALSNIADDYLFTFSNHYAIDGTRIVSCA
jgi:hypothetical protein